MNDKIKTDLDKHFDRFIEGLGPEDKALVEKLKIDLKELFDSQKNADRARRDIGKDFNKIMSSYFSQFKTKSGFDYASLYNKVLDKEKVFLRHLGTDKLQYLKLILSLRADLEFKKRGLLLAN